MNGSEKLKVSVTVVSFNQKEYISECLDSILMQETDFEFEVIVGDDCSTDGTADILRDYQKNYPDIIRLFLNEKNTYNIDRSNFRHVVEQSKGEYITHMDADDLMLTGKLQKQADFLDKHEECFMCHHHMYLLSGDEDFSGSEKLSKYHYQNDVIDCDEFLSNVYSIRHSSKMYRRNSVPEGGFLYTTDYFALDIVWVAQSMVVSKGKIGFIRQPLGVYRVNVGVMAGDTFHIKGLQGVEASIGILKESGMCSIEAINKAFSLHYSYYSVLALLNADNERFYSLIEKARSCAKLSGKYYLLNMLKGFPGMLKLFARMYNKYYT